ncbi:MAG TPA: MBL fold metallo-hydrolase [Thermoanaerobaculia bacterium]|nr:MBL fold metallo-hydrolase [Thermoanaerobaculia bacterium]
MPQDYPPGRGRVSLEAAGIPIEGVSIAGHESFYKLPTLRTLLEFGRAPEDVLGYATVCVSHGHLDHMAGLAHYGSRRRLAELPTSRVFVPEEAAPDVTQWLEACQRLERIDYDLEVVPASPGDRLRLRNDLELTVLPGRHRVPTVGYLFSEMRHKLRDELAGKPGAEIAALRASGVEVTRPERLPLLAYPGDCSAEIFDACPELFGARVLLLECSFVLPEDRDRANEYGHIHLDDLVERAGRFENEAVVLTHFSQRYTPPQIRAALQRLPEPLLGRTMAFLPPP